MARESVSVLKFRCYTTGESFGRAAKPDDNIVAVFDAHMKETIDKPLRTGITQALAYECINLAAVGSTNVWMPRCRRWELSAFADEFPLGFFPEWGIWTLVDGWTPLVGYFLRHFISHCLQGNRNFFDVRPGAPSFEETD